MTKLKLWAYPCDHYGVDFGVTFASSGQDMTSIGWIYIKEIEVDVDNEQVAKKIAAMKNSSKAAKRERLMKQLQDLAGDL